jgi:hypothetical protein
MVGKIFLDNVLIREGKSNLGLNFKANLMHTLSQILKGENLLTMNNTKSFKN